MPSSSRGERQPVAKIGVGLVSRPSPGGVPMCRAGSSRPIQVIGRPDSRIDGRAPIPYLSFGWPWHLVRESRLPYSESIPSARSGDDLGEASMVSDSFDLETAEYGCLVSPSARETSRV